MIKKEKYRYSDFHIFFMKLTIALILLLISNAALADLPPSVIAQHKNGASHQLSDEDTQFTFIGTFDSISNESYMTPHGESWSISLRIEKLLLGSHYKKMCKSVLPTRMTLHSNRILSITSPLIGEGMA